MGNKMQFKNKRLRWLLVWLVQIIVSFLLGLMAAASYFLGGLVHNLFIWGLIPLSGLILALMATKLGLLNYAALLAPPIMEFLAHLLIWGYGLNAGPVFLCAFTSLVGAAAGEVLKRQSQK